MNDTLKIFDWLNMAFLDIFQIETRTERYHWHDVEEGLLHSSLCLDSTQGGDFCVTVDTKCNWGWRTRC